MRGAKLMGEMASKACYKQYVLKGVRRRIFTAMDLERMNGCTRIFTY